MLDPETRPPSRQPCNSGPARWPVLDLLIAAALAAGLAAFAAASWLGVPTPNNPETIGRHAHSAQADRRA